MEGGGGKVVGVRLNHGLTMSPANHPLAGSLPWNQSPAAAMGAELLGSVTLPVWAQPWYALS